MNIYLIKNTIRRAKIIIREPEYGLRQIKYKIFTKILSKVSSDSPYINEATILLTFKCNLRCKMCPQWGDFGLCREENYNDEIKISDLKNFIDDLSIFNPSVIVLSGGEPFLYTGWYELSKYIKRKNLKICVITNGTLIENYFKQIIETVDELNISLDGIDEIHNKIRGQGSFEKALTGIKKIQKESKKPYINIACTISDLNYKNLEEIIKFFNEEKIKINNFIFQHLLFLDEKTIEKQKEKFKKDFNIENNFWYGFRYQPENLDINILMKEIEKLKKYNNVVFHPNFKEKDCSLFYTNPSFLISKRCSAPYLETTILPDGDVWLCPDYVIGNIKEQRFKNLWNNEKAKILRNNIQKNGIFPACRSCCYLYSY